MRCRFARTFGNWRVSVLVLAFLTHIPALPASNREPDQPRLPDGLDPLIQPYPAAVEKVLKALKQGVEDYQQGRYSAALSSLPDPASSATTAVADFALLYRANSFLAMEKPDEALRYFRLLQSRFPASSRLGESIRGEAQAWLKLGKPVEALAALRNPKLEETAESLDLRARCHEEAGERTEAADLYLRLYSDFVTYKQSSLALQRLQAIAPKSAGPGSNYRMFLRRAENLVRAGKNAEARDLLLMLGKTKAPGPEGYQRGALLMAQTEYNLGKAEPALKYLKAVTKADPSMHAQALYLEGAVYRRLEDEDAFLSTRDEAVRLYPRSPHTERLLNSVATYFDVADRLEDASAAYKVLVERFPGGEYAQRARWRLPTFDYANRNYEGALRGFWDYITHHPEPGNAAAALYWMGRCYADLQDYGRALYLYGRAKSLANDSYYGQLSREAESSLKQAGETRSHSYEGIDSEQVKRLAESLSFPHAAIEAPTEPAQRSIERARQLAAADLLDLALAELRWATRRLPEDRAIRFVMARVYEAKEEYQGVIATLREVFPNYDRLPYHALPEEVWNLFFPVRHWKYIVARAGKNGIDPVMVLALIRQESAFQEDARSSANARGLMQVLPGTGRRIAREAGVGPYTSGKLYQPETNIALGIHYMTELLERYPGRIELMLAAYNAGENRVERWLEDFGNVNLPEFVERIPFSETRGYVKQVLTNAAHYRRITAVLRDAAQ